MDKPFIKLLHSINAHYFYDVGKNDIVKIPFSTFEYLRNLLGNQNVVLTNEIKERIDVLLEAGYLSAKKPAKIRHPLSDHIPLFLERRLDSMVLQLTQDCNFRCRYCIYSDESHGFQRPHSEQYMSWEIAKKSIDFFIKNSIDSPMCRIGFYGGEPLLNWDILKRVVEYLESRLEGRKITLNLTTNGSLLTPSKADFLQKHGVAVLVSVDGDRETHNKNRIYKNGEGTYDTIISNLLKLKEVNKEFFSSLRFSVVLDPQHDVDGIKPLSIDVNEFFYSSMRLSFMEVNDSVAEYSEEYLSKSEYWGFVALISHLMNFDEDRINPIGEKYLEEYINHMKGLDTADGMSDIISPSGPCIPGKSRLLVSVSGQFFPCEKISESALMCIGSIEKGFDYDKIDQLLNIASITTEECCECWALRLCSQCAKTAGVGNALSKEKRLMSCRNSLFNAEKKLRSIVLNREIFDYYNH